MNDSLLSPTENPKGLHAKYKIKKFSHVKKTGFFDTETPVYKNVEKDSEYFILRLDNNQKDEKHREACISAVLHYAELIKDHLPELAHDIKKRYGIPVDVTEAQNYISNCEKDMGFMGSPKYYEAKEIVNAYYKKQNP